MKKEKITWKLEKVQIAQLKPFEENPRIITEKGLKDLSTSIDRFGLPEKIVCNTDYTVIGGHARLLSLKSNGETETEIFIPSRILTDKEVEELIRKKKLKFCNCKQCGHIFLNTMKGARIKVYCSIECLSSYMQKTRSCLYCGSTMVYNRQNQRTNKKFCSKSCSTKHRHEFGQSYEMKQRLSDAKTGVPLTDFHKEQLSKAKKGKPILHFINNMDAIKKKISESLIGKPQPWNRGENHPNYVDGGKSQWERQKAMGRVEYKNWRRYVFERDDFTCQHCGKRGSKIQADHIKSWRDYPELRYDVNNGRTLCKSCHVKTDTYGGKKKVA
jgi:hypothetical protein